MQRQFWWLQIIGWFTYTIVVFVTVVSPFMSEGKEIQQILHLVVEILVGFCTTLLMWLIVIRLNAAKTSYLIAACVSLALVLSCGFNMAKLISHKVVVNNEGWNTWTWQDFGIWYLFSFATILVWATFFVVILYNDKLQKQSAKAMKAESLAKESQLRMLRYQLNPHFMFNSMNSISTLILKKETDKANEMLELLCDFLRYSLETNTEIKSTLKEELKSAELYLQIEKVRFGERLKYEKSVDFGLLKALVPSFFLQPIIENSVKYAIVNNKEGGTICIDVNRVGDSISICVADHVDMRKYKVSTAQPSLGIGLKNIDERLSAIYGDDCKVTMNENQHNGMTVCVTVPIEFGDEYEYRRDKNANR